MVGGFSRLENRQRADSQLIGVADRVDSRHPSVYSQIDAIADLDDLESLRTVETADVLV